MADLPRTHPCPAGAYPNADGGVVCVYVEPTHQCYYRITASPSASCAFATSIVKMWDRGCYLYYQCTSTVTSQ